MPVACNVVGCLYVAEAFIEECGGFPVCPLHDCWQVREMLDTLRLPCSYVSSGRPIVMPDLPLEEKHLAHRPAARIFRTENEGGLWTCCDEDGTLRAENDKFLHEMLAAAEGKRSTVLARFDVIRERPRDDH